MAKTRVSCLTAPAFSPDGRCLADGLGRTGREQVYLVPYPGVKPVVRGIAPPTTDTRIAVLLPWDTP